MKKIIILFILVIVTVTYKADANDKPYSEFTRVCKTFKKQQLIEISEKYNYCRFKRKVDSREALLMISSCIEEKKDTTFGPQMGGYLQVRCH